MKTDIHPKYMETKVHCNGCGTEFTTHSTVPEITVEICSNCHPFYTGKQKLVDTAGRVDKFNARRAAAEQAQKNKPKKQADPEVAKIENELEENTVTLKDQPSEEPASDTPSAPTTDDKVADADTAEVASEPEATDKPSEDSTETPNEAEPADESA